MSNLASPYPEDSWSSSQPTNKSVKDEKNKNTFPTSSVCPIDESEEFFDPFSDLSLFLSKQIKSEITKHGSGKKWSHKIQNELIEKILPEFKQKFPKYRLGGSALKKIWEKVSHYYTKIYNQTGAFNKEGQLNVEYMIRENIKNYPLQDFPSDLPPYNCAHQLALKISECIATIDGKKSNMDQLTKTIWAVQKHLLPNLSSANAKNPYEEHHMIDKLIVKTLLETITKEPHLSAIQIAQKIKQELKLFEKINHLTKHNQLTSFISVLLANTLYHKIPFHHLLSQEELNALEQFITRHIQLNYTEQTLSLDSCHLDLVQRILTLYPIVSRLPHNIDEKQLKETIKFVYFSHTNTHLNYCPVVPQSVYIYINAEMHFLKESEELKTLDQFQKEIIASYHAAKNLPIFEIGDSDPFEIFIWKVIDQKENLLTQVPQEIKNKLFNEIANIMIDTPKHTFRGAINTTMQFFKKIQKLSLNAEEKTISCKINLWTIQNDMICRWIHFDENNPLLILLLEQWHLLKLKDDRVDHHLFVDRVFTLHLKQNPSLTPYKKEVEIRTWILYKYLWYTTLATSSESTYDRFLKWQKRVLNDNQLEQTSESLLPLTPFKHQA